MVLANVKVNEEIMRELTQEDRMGLDAIYWHRCLNAPLLYRYFYVQADARMEYAQERIRQLVSKKVLAEVEYGGQYPALFLTTLGVAIVKLLRGALNGAVKNRRQMDRSSYELKMNPKTIPHQVALNTFVLSVCSKLNDGIEYQYYDEKFMPPAAESLMPDGMFEFRDYIVLLEMDMGTERAAHMERKWNNYRTFLEYKGPFYQNRDIIMLFILDNVKSLSRRKRTVWASLGRFLIDKIDGTFEVYVDAPAVLQNILTEKEAMKASSELLPGIGLKPLIATHGYSISPIRAEKIAPLRFDAYIRKLTPAGKVMTQDNRPQEFILDIWLDGRLSVLHKIMYYHNVERALKAKLGRSIAYLVVVPDERWINKTLALYDARGIQNVFFTTIVRLEGEKLNEALFQLDGLGTVHHFSNMGLKELVYERRIKGR